MADKPSSTTAAWGLLPTAPPASVFGARLSRRLTLDRIAVIVVRGGGMAIIASILAILFVLFWEVYPLLESPTLERFASFATDESAPPLAIGVDEYREFGYTASSSGLRFFTLKTGKPIDEMKPIDLGGATVTSASAFGRGPFALGLSDGRAIPVKVTFPFEFAEGVRSSKPELVTSEPLVVDPSGRPLRALAYSDSPRGLIVAALVGERELAILSVTETTPLIGEPVREQTRETIPLEGEGNTTAIAVDLRGDNVLVGDAKGNVTRVTLSGGEKPSVAETIPARAGVAITALAFLIGDRTLVVGDESGGVVSWQLLRAEGGGERLSRTNEFEPHAAAVTAIDPSSRHKGFVSGDRAGEIKFRFGTTGETLLAGRAETGGVSALAFTPKSNGVLVVSGAGALESWELYAPHPETTFRSLFGKVWYEGYEQPEYVWQSTGGTDDFEPKLSLTPLIYGTLKGTAYALMVAIPLALLGALYASQFMHPTLKGYAKPTIEIMAALPSVVLGFIAGLWLAPSVERIVPGIFLMPFVTAGLVLVASYLWRMMPGGARARRAGTEVFLLVPLVLLGAWLSIRLGYAFESFMLGGDYRRWLLDVLGLTYDQRNSLVVGLAMGFAVIPIIFTIAEDSLSSVPNHLRAGSLALGATSWQTAVRVILPTASPGIFSAIMIGFGRAVGETMIVLMATGNTPVMNASIFSGFRALSANIAVELPEAPEGGTLYRVLFLAALLLFLLTFVVNTAAELVRLRLRNRYRVL
jgi:phosphate transport system permease protein